MIFAKNVQRIIENNRHAEANNMSFRMALNSFADIDDNEFRSGYIPLRNMTMLRHKASRSEVLSMARMSSSAPKSKSNALNLLVDEFNLSLSLSLSLISLIFD